MTKASVGVLRYNTHEKTTKRDQYSTSLRPDKDVHYKINKHPPEQPGL